jgi:hypothetical protein
VKRALYHNGVPYATGRENLPYREVQGPAGPLNHQYAPRLMIFTRHNGDTARGYGSCGKPDPAAAPFRCPDCRRWVCMPHVSTRDRGGRLWEKTGNALHIHHCKGS